MKYEERKVSLEEYQWLRKSVGWGNTDTAATKDGLENSLYSVAVVKNGKVIAIGRVIGDGGLYFYIQDLMVHPEYQNKGIGKSLIKKLMDYITSNAKSGAFVGLMAAKGLKKFYEPYGFKVRDEDAPGMYQTIK